MTNKLLNTLKNFFKPKSVEPESEIHETDSTVV